MKNHRTHMIRIDGKRIGKTCERKICRQKPSFSFSYPPLIFETSSMNIEVSAKQLSDGLQIINKTQKLHLHFYSIFPFRLEHLDYFTAISLFAHFIVFINHSIVIIQLLLCQYILRQNQVR